MSEGGVPLELRPGLASLFGERWAALELYLTFERRLLAALPETEIRVQKTQITFINRHVFGCVSLKRIKGCPEVFIIVSFGLGRRESSPRVAVSVEPYPGRWTHHVVVSDASEIDSRLLGWLAEASAFSANK